MPAALSALYWALLFFSAYRKPGFVACGVSLSSLKPSRASGSGMWSKNEVSKNSGVTVTAFYTRTQKVNVIMHQRANMASQHEEGWAPTTFSLFPVGVLSLLCSVLMYSFFSHTHNKSKGVHAKDLCSIHSYLSAYCAAHSYLVSPVLVLWNICQVSIWPLWRQSQVSSGLSS